MSAMNLDLSLEDIIKSSSKNKSGNSGIMNNNTSNRRKMGVARTNKRRPAPKFSDPYSKKFTTARRGPSEVWKHDLYEGDSEDNLPSSSGRKSSDPKLIVSNLHYNVTEEDIRKLFNSVGNVKSLSLNYDKAGRSKGSAVVTYFNENDAIAAIQRFNNVELDGMPMRIKQVDGGIFDRLGPRSAQSKPGRSNQRSNRGSRRQQRSNPRSKKPVTAEQLDAEMQAYMVDERGKQEGITNSVPAENPSITISQSKVLEDNDTEMMDL